MKLKNGVIVSAFDDEYVLVDSGVEGKRFNGMIKLNSSAAFIVESLKNEKSYENLLLNFCEKYDVDMEKSQKAVDKVLNKLLTVGIVNE